MRESSADTPAGRRSAGIAHPLASPVPTEGNSHKARVAGPSFSQAQRRMEPVPPEIADYSLNRGLDVRGGGEQLFSETVFAIPKGLMSNFAQQQSHSEHSRFRRDDILLPDGTWCISQMR